MLYDCGVIVMKWKEKNGIRQGEYCVYEDGVARYIGYWENVFGSGDIIRLLNRKKGKLMQLIDRNKRTRVYLGGYNSEWKPHGKGVEFNRSTGLPMYESIWENGVRTHIVKEIRNTKMIEYSENYTNIELSDKLPIYCGGFLYDETSDEFLRHGTGCLLDKFGCATEEAIWERGIKKSSTHLKDGWYFLSVSPNVNEGAKIDSNSDNVPILKVSSSKNNDSSKSDLDNSSRNDASSKKDSSVNDSTKKDTSSKKSATKKEDTVNNAVKDNTSTENLSTDNASKGSKSRRRKSKKNASKNDSSSIMNDLIDIFGTDFGASSSTDNTSLPKTKKSTEETKDVSQSQPAGIQQEEKQSSGEVVVSSQQELENESEARSIIVAPNSCNNELVLLLLSHCCLEHLKIGNNCYCNVNTVKISFLSNLKILEISKNSFVSEESKGGSLLIKECSSLESILISHHSFQYFTSFKLQDLCRLKSLKVGELPTESLCFKDASFEIKCSCVYFY